MKYLIILCLPLLVSCGSSAVLTIPANNKIDLDYPDYIRYSVELKNKSKEEVEVRVKSKSTGEFFSGFGLAPKGEATVTVNNQGILEIKNPNNKDVKVAMSVPEEQDATRPLTSASSVSFTLNNASAKSIPLIIPGVMNPNLSPFSNSGVDLEMGQEIFFKVKSKKYLLLTVDDTIAPGSKLDVAKLIKQRKQELGI